MQCVPCVQCVSVFCVVSSDSDSDAMQSGAVQSSAVQSECVTIQSKQIHILWLPHTWYASALPSCQANALTTPLGGGTHPLVSKVGGEVVTDMLGGIDFFNLPDEEDTDESVIVEDSGGSSIDEDAEDAK